MKKFIWFILKQRCGGDEITKYIIEHSSMLLIYLGEKSRVRDYIAI